MPYPYTLDSVLVGAPRHVDLRVTHILFDRIRERCAEHGIREGSRVRCVGETPQHLLLELPGQGATTLSLGFGACVHVEPAEATPAAHTAHAVAYV
jgi:hypothetical protein